MNGRSIAERRTASEYHGDSVSIIFIGVGEEIELFARTLWRSWCRPVFMWSKAE